VPGRRDGRAWAENPLQRRADREQHVAQPGVGEVVVMAAEHPQPVERLVRDLEPVQPPRVCPRGVGEHEAVAAVGLGLARVELAARRITSPGR
jgi:hypothetical protein